MSALSHRSRTNCLDRENVCYGKKAANGFKCSPCSSLRIGFSSGCCHVCVVGGGGGEGEREREDREGSPKAVGSICASRDVSRLTFLKSM